MKKETLLPINIEKSKKLKDNDKLLLDYLIRWNGTDQARENGYFFRSNKAIETDLNIFPATLINCLNKLINMGLITRETGFRNIGNKQASKYTLNVEAINNFNDCNTTNNMGNTTNNMGNTTNNNMGNTTNNMGNNTTNNMGNTTNNMGNTTNNMGNILEELLTSQSEILKEILKKINKLEELLIGNNNNMGNSSDLDTNITSDIEIDIISNNYNNNYSHNIKAGYESQPSNILGFDNNNKINYILGNTNEKKLEENEIENNLNQNLKNSRLDDERPSLNQNNIEIEEKMKIEEIENNNKNEGGSSTTATNIDTKEEKDMIPTQAEKQENDRVGIDNCQPSNNPQENKTNNTPTVEQVKSASDTHQEDLEHFNKLLHKYPCGIDSLHKLEKRNRKFTKWITEIFGDDEALLQECLAQAEERYQIMKEQLTPTVGVTKIASDTHQEDLVEHFNKLLHKYPCGIDSLHKLEERNKKFIKWIKENFDDDEALLQECLAQAEGRYEFMKEKLTPTKPKEPFFSNNEVMPLPLDVLVNTIDPEKDGTLLAKIIKFKDKSLLEYKRFPDATPQAIEDIHQAKLEQIKEICRSCLIFTVQPSLKEAANQEYKKAMERAKIREAELAQATTQSNDLV